MARRQLAAHAQPALHARRAAGRAHGRLSGRGILAGPEESHRRPHQRNPGAARDPRFRDLPRLDAPPRRALPALALGHPATVAHQRLLHGRRQGLGQCLLPQRRSSSACTSATRRRWTGWSSSTAASSRPASAASASRRRACVVASGGFESNREWLREAWGQVDGEWLADNFLIRGTRFNMGVLLKFLIGAGADAIGDPTQSHCVAIDARAPLVRRRHLHPRRLRVAGHRRQQARPALLRRGRGLLAQALRDLGPAGGAAARADRLLDHRRQGHRPLHAAGIPGRESGIRCRNLRASSAWTRRPSCAPCATTTRPAAPAPSTTRRSTTAAPTASRRRRRIGRALSIPPPFYAYAAQARHHFHLPRRESERAGRGAFRRASPAPTCSPPAKSWPATCSARATPPGSA